MGGIYFSQGTSHSKGVCVLINQAAKEKVTFTSSDADPNLHSTRSQHDIIIIVVAKRGSLGTAFL